MTFDEVLEQVRELVQSKGPRGLSGAQNGASTWMTHIWKT